MFLNSNFSAPNTKPTLCFKEVSIIKKNLCFFFLQLDGKQAGASVEEDEHESEYHKL